MRSEELKNPNLREAKTFRLRFGVPYAVFVWFTEWTKNWYEVTKYNPSGYINLSQHLGKQQLQLSRKYSLAFVYSGEIRVWMEFLSYAMSLFLSYLSFSNCGSEKS